MRLRAIPLLALLGALPAWMPSAPAAAQVSFGLSITVAPPALPVYVQPPIPAPGYLWAPGYWAWGGSDYYWVPGTWVLAPEAGYLWTPGYWGWTDGYYLWHAGYWGPHVGFYGGIAYGFGYLGTGYVGGYWRGGAFFYNRSCNNVAGSVHITNVYNRTVINNVTVNRVRFNGGRGGIAARPSAQEMAFEHERRLPAGGEQVRHEQVARSEPAMHLASNHGRPAIAATAHPGIFSGPGISAARATAAPARREGASAHIGAPSHDAAPSSMQRRAPVSAPPPRAAPERGTAERGIPERRQGPPERER